MHTIRIFMLGAATAIGMASLSARPLSAMPLVPGSGVELAAQAASSSLLTEVRVRRRNSGAAAAGIAAGILLGTIIASQRGYYYDYPPYPYYAPYPYPYYPPGYRVYRPYWPPDGAIAYCMRRFRSYDPYTRTYLGYDGLRHPCP